MSKFSEQVHITINSFSQNIIYSDLKLSQKMADHHYFSFVWQYSGRAVIAPEDQAKAVAEHIGSEVIFTFKVNDIKLMSKGIIKSLKSVDLHGSPAGLHVTGISHTVVLSDMKKSRIFLNKTLQQIALEIFAEESSGEFYQREAIKPTLTKTFGCKPQYNETGFEFMKRLSARYGEWFYFDGMRMQFGQLKSSRVELIAGSSLHGFTYEANLVSSKISLGGYDYSSASNIRNSSLKTAAGSRDRFAISMGWNQDAITNSDLSVGAYTNNAQNKEEIEEMVRLQTAGSDANRIFYSGISYYPIGLGQVFVIHNKEIRHDLVAIEVVHHSEVNGNYRCEFRAIPSDVAAPHYTDVKAFAEAETQPAKVTDNNDPEGLGRVKVEFYWNGWGNDSDWMRVVQHYAGPSRGTYYRPEIGDEVLVSFEGGNVERPYVSGSHYNGQAKPEFFDPKNSIKGWKFRFGQMLKFIEKIGIWLSDPSGNEIHLDEQGKNINVITPETFTIRAKNIVFEAAESITFTAGTNISETATINKTTSVGGILNTSVTGDKILHVGGIYDANIEGDCNLDHKKDRNVMSNGKVRSNSENGHQIHSKKDIQNNSSENTSQN
ncbi:phage baseplate assembly protein V [Flavobacterium sp. TR2]|uniref:type VI secretion system Vgr family protein n=1 Tax=Flavobacterium sp. TR2 TaxID=2977321 RepID=UPI0021B11177|nr:phage baseplate assembly protein V [Flavobacterium sp. TR2]UWY29897.1 phage baseplate assembly protein V [Flavobacterium sp. TR2]